MLSVSRHLTDRKLGLQDDISCTYDTDLEHVLQCHKLNLQSHNVVDLMDILTKVRDEKQTNEGLAQRLAALNVVVLKAPKATVEVSIVFYNVDLTLLLKIFNYSVYLNKIKS